MVKMKYLQSFDWTGETFEERIGEPDPVEAAVGRIAMNFSDLEHTVDRFFHYLAGLQPGRAIISPATLSFRQKVDLLASTVSELKDVLGFNTGPAPTDEFFGELKHNCIQADALYREIMGARWGGRRANGAIEVLGSHNPTSEQKHPPMGILDASKLLDIGDFICYAEYELEEFFLDPEILISESA
jgi:hypothetical protein